MRAPKRFSASIDTSELPDSENNLMAITNGTAPSDLNKVNNNGRLTAHIRQADKGLSLLVTGNFPPYGGPNPGWYARTRAIGATLARSGFKVDVVALRRARHWGQKIRDERIRHYWVRHVLCLYDNIPSSDLPTLERLLSAVLRAVRHATAFFSGDSQGIAVPRYRSRLRGLLGNKIYKVTVISTPPHSLLRLVPFLRRASSGSQRIVLDLRDPCTLGGIFMSRTGPIGRAVLRRAEKAAISAANEVWVVSQGMMERYANAYPISANKFRVVENGFVTYDELPSVDSRIREFYLLQRAQGRIVLGYFGSGFFGRQATRGKRVTLLFEAVARLDPTGSLIAIVVQGQVRGKQPKTTTPTLYLPSTSNPQARVNMSMLDAGTVLYDNTEDADTILGGKVFDYMASGVPLWIIASRNATSLKELALRHPWLTVFSEAEDKDNIKRGFETIKRIVAERNSNTTRWRDEMLRVQAYDRQKTIGRALFSDG